MPQKILNPFGRDEYIGELTDIKPKDGTYSWTINPYDVDGDPSGGLDILQYKTQWLDAKNIEHWTKYVNGSTNESTANIESFQHYNHIFYEIKYKIKKGQELLTWYGSEYYNEHCTPK